MQFSTDAYVNTLAEGGVELHLLHQGETALEVGGVFAGQIFFHLMLPLDDPMDSGQRFDADGHSESGGVKLLKSLHHQALANGYGIHLDYLLEAIDAANLKRFPQRKGRAKRDG
jgi:hypothetical protein